MTPKEADDLLHELYKACKNDPNPTEEFMAAVWFALESIICERMTVAEAEKYLYKKVSENNQKVKP